MVLGVLWQFCFIIGWCVAKGVGWTVVGSVMDGLLLLLYFQLCLEVLQIDSEVSAEEQPTGRAPFNVCLQRLRKRFLADRLRLRWLEEFGCATQSPPVSVDCFVDLEQRIEGFKQTFGATECLILWQSTTLDGSKIQWISSAGEQSRLRRALKGCLDQIADTSSSWGELLVSIKSPLRQKLLRLYGLNLVLDHHFAGDNIRGVILLAFESGSVTDQTQELLTQAANLLAADLALSSTLGQYRDQVALERDRRHARDVGYSFLSHDIRTPLNNIMAASKLAHAAVDASERERLLDLVVSNCRRIADLVDRVLEFSKQTVTSEAVVDHALEFVSWSELRQEIWAVWTLAARDQGLLLKVDPESELSFACVGSDLRRVVDNLLSNALKYTEVGQVEVACRASTNDQFVDLVISDSGSGMEPHQILQAEQMFERLGRADSQGFGLGLAVTKSLVERNGGRLHITSIPKVGTTVRVRLPRGGSAPVSKIQNLEVTLGKLLLVEDDVDLRCLWERQLQKLGWRVLAVGSIAAAVDLVTGDSSSDSFVAVVTDWQVADQEAVELLVGPATHLRFAVVSGSEQARQQIDAERGRWFRKPVEIAEVHDWLVQSM